MEAFEPKANHLRIREIVASIRGPTHDAMTTAVGCSETAERQTYFELRRDR